MQIQISEVKKRMIIDDGSDRVIISEAWEDQGPGLGIVLKGQKVADGSAYLRRFLNPELMVEQIGKIL